jgi:hypothetical protein
MYRHKVDCPIIASSTMAALIFECPNLSTLISFWNISRAHGNGFYLTGRLGSQI